MKNHLFLILLHVSSIIIASNRNISTRPKQVTVYLQGAQIYHYEELNIPSGTSEISFIGVSPNLDPSTIISSGKGDFTILETRFNTRYPETIEEKVPNPLHEKYQKQINSKSDSISELNYSLKLLESRKKKLNS